MSNKSVATITTMGTGIGKNSFHVVGLDLTSTWIGGTLMLVEELSTASRTDVSNCGNTQAYSITSSARTKIERGHDGLLPRSESRIATRRASRR